MRYGFLHANNDAAHFPLPDGLCLLLSFLIVA